MLAMRINELDTVCSPDKQDRIHEFCDWCCEQLGINVPHLNLKPKNDTSALGYTDMSDGSVTIVVGDRHQMDIMRTLAHELVHCKQMEAYTPDGATGSDDENEANAMAGVLMREWGQNNPDLYTEDYQMDEGKQKMSAQDKFNKRLKDKHGMDLDAKEKFYADMKKKFQQSMNKTNENVQTVEAELEESKTARMMALITALGAAYGLEDDAREFAHKISQNIDNAQNAEPNPGRPDPVSKGNPLPGADRVMRPPVDEMGAGGVAMALGRHALKKSRQEIDDDEANEASTTSKILKGAPGAPSGKPKSMREKAVSKSQQRFFGMVDALKKGDNVKGATADMKKAAKDMTNKDVKDFARTKHKGLPNRVSEAVNVQAIKDEVIGAVRSGNPREMKRVDDTIAKRISDLMDLRGTAGKEVDAQIKDALPVLKKAQMYLRDKKLGEDAYDDMDQKIQAHAEQFAIKGKDLEKYVGKTITLWTEGSSNPPLQRTYKIDPGKNGQGVSIEGEYYGPGDFVDHNAAADYSWKSEKAANHYSDLQDQYHELDEAKKDACYNKVRSRYKVWPSAYASGALVQCRKKGAKNWGNKSK